MGWTKRAIVEDAYAELALASYQFDLTPEEMQFGLRRLDLLMATLMAGGTVLPYSMSLSPTDGDLDQDSGLPLTAVEAVVINLAVRIAAGKGKALAQSTKQNAKSAMDALLVSLSHTDLRQQQLRSSTPRGSGNRGWGLRRPFVCEPDVSPLTASSSGDLQFNED